MGGIISGVLGTNNEIGVNKDNPLASQDYAGELSRGTGNYSSTYNNQNQLAQQLQQQANGEGPNPAASMLQAAQGQAANQAAGVYANNRAINPALAARSASQLQSQAAGNAANQAATLRANQQIQAQQNLGNLYNQMGNQALNYYGTTQNALGSANQQNAGLAMNNQNTNSSIIGGLIGGAGAALMADGGEVQDIGNAGPGSFAGQFLSSYKGANGQVAPLTNGFVQLGKGIHNQMDLNKTPETDSGFKMPELGASQFGGSGPTLYNSAPTGLAGPASMSTDFGVSGSPFFSASTMAPLTALAKGGMAKKGGVIPGKALVPGDSLKNDTVPTMLSPGEIVLPRSVTQGKDAPTNAAKFVRAVMAKNKLKRKA